jgi:hypothetical protein
MTLGRLRAQWDIAAEQLALFANAHSSKRRFKPSDFHRYPRPVVRQKPARTISAAAATDLVCGPRKPPKP